MVSLRARLLPMLLRATLQRRLRPHVPVDQQRQAMLRWAKLGRVPWRTRVETLTLNGRPAERLAPRRGGCQPDPVLLLHGGGYCWGGLDTHREVAARIALAARRPVYLLDYRLAPEHPFPAALDDATGAYRELQLLSDGASISLVGDSAGGGLTLATCLRLRAEGDRLPDRMALISPWVDLTQSGDSVRQRVELEPMLNPQTLEVCAQRYAAGRPVSDPQLSPLWADLAGLPPVLIQVGENEILLDDSRRLAERLATAGVQVEIEIAKQMWHIWHLFASAIPEGQTAINRLASFLTE